MASSSPARARPDHEDSRPTEIRQVKRQLNVRLLSVTLIVAAVLGPAAYFWREFQVKRTAGAFLSRADSLEKDEEWTQAASHLFRYLQLRPDDADVRIRLAKVFDKPAAQDARLKSRAVDLYYRAVSVASPEQRSALRGRLAELLLQLERFQAAEEEAEKLIAEKPGDLLGTRVRALARFRQYDLGSRAARSDDGVFIGEELKEALKREPGNITLAGTMAHIYRTESLLPILSAEEQALSESERASLADEVMNRLLEANGENVAAFQARYLYRDQYELPGAKDDLDRAMELAPNDLETLLFAANHNRREALRVLREGGSTADARKAMDGLLTTAGEHYNQIISKVAPRDERAYMGLGDVLSLLGRNDEAIETWRNGLAAGNQDSIFLNLRLAELLIAIGRIDPAEEVLNDLSAAADKRVATLPRPTRYSLERSISMLKAQFFAAKDEPRNAIVELKRVLAGQPSSEAEVRQALRAEMLLGSIHASSGEWDLAAAVFERAAMSQPDSAVPRLAAAAAAARLNPETAIRHYEMALALGDATSIGPAVSGVQRAEAWLALARARFQKQKKLPEEDRNWGPYLKAISEAASSDGETSLPNAWRVDLLQADYLALIGEREGGRQQGMLDATRHLRQAEEKYPNSESLQLGLVLGYELYGAAEDADRALEKLEGLTGKSVTTYKLRSHLFSSRGQYEKARKILEEGLEVLPSKDDDELGQALVRVSRVEGSRAGLLELHKRDPKDGGLICRLIELAFEQGDLEGAEQWEGKLRDLEGPDSPYADYCDYCKVRRLLAAAKGQQDPKFVEAAKLLSDLERRQPDSGHLRYLRGVTLQVQGERPEAIEAYQDAIRLGMQTASVYERLIALLGDEGRFDEARTYLSKAKDRGISSDRLGELETAAELSHAQTLAANEKPEEAEAAFQEAIRRAPTNWRPYIALFNFYLQTKHKDLASQTLRELEENVNLSPGELAFLLAESYERLGDLEQAEANYREAQRLNPENTVIQMRLASFLTRAGKAHEAEAILRAVVEKDPRADAARYQLADILVARGGKEEWQEALKFLEQSGTDESVFNLDRRLQALLLIKRGGRNNLKKARELLEGLVLNTEDPADANRLLLAQVYEAEISRLQGEGEGDAEGADEVLEDARQQYLAVAGRANPNPSHLALFVEFLIRNDEAGAASGYLDRLEKLTPDSLGTMRLRARWLHSENRTEELKPLVESLAEKILRKAADDPGAEVRLASSVGNIYLNVELHQEAERWYRRLVELDPTGYAPLVNVLARQDRMQEAIDVCVEAAQSDRSTRPASSLASILVAEKASEEELQQAEPVLKRAIEDHPSDVVLLLNLANLRVSRKQVDEADRLYQRVLELEPKNLMALNNRATLLSELPEKNKEALETINRAIELAGEQAAFLDTKGMIFVFGGEPKRAVPFLETAAYSTDSDPRYHFHLAVAHVRNGDLKKAHDALQEANRGDDLKNQFLTEMDLRLLEELQEKLRDQ